MYKNIIFDLGNVLLDYRPMEYLKKKIEKTDKICELNKAIFQSEQWVMLDRGVLTEEEAINAIIKNNAENEELIKLTFENWYDLLTPIDVTVKVLEELKKANYNLYFLSNFHLLAFKYVTKKYDFFKLFNGGIVSYKEKLIKPEEKIYRRLIEEYNIKPEESIFVDDVKANIDGARELNFGTIHLEKCADLKKQLKDYGINL